MYLWGMCSTGPALGAVISSVPQSLLARCSPCHNVSPTLLLLLPSISSFSIAKGVTASDSPHLPLRPSSSPSLCAVPVEHARDLPSSFHRPPFAPPPCSAAVSKESRCQAKRFDTFPRAPETHLEL